MDLRPIVLGAILVLGFIRLFEIALNAVNVRRLRRTGATSHGLAGLPVIVLGQVLLFLGLLIEGWWVPPHPQTNAFTMPLLALATLGLLLRYWCIATLGRRWTMAVYTTDEPLVQRGPYRLLRHPNYLAVAVELVALAAALQCWATLGVAGAVTCAGLTYRIRRENQILSPLRPRTRPRQTS